MAVFFIAFVPPLEKSGFFVNAFFKFFTPSEIKKPLRENGVEPPFIPEEASFSKIYYISRQVWLAFTDYFSASARAFCSRLSTASLTS